MIGRPPKPVMERINAQVNIDEHGCWIYAADRAPRSGYRQVRVGQMLRYAHRVTYEALVGAIPDGLVIDHLCHNRSCVNPSHMEPVTQQENTLRGNGPAAINSRKTHCPQGHALTAENVYGAPMRRQCKTCSHSRYTEGLASAATLIQEQEN